MGVCRRGRREPLVVKEVRGAHVASTEVGMEVSMDLVGAGLGYDAQNQVSGLPIFGVVIVGKNLKLANLFDGRAYRIARRLTAVRNVSAVNIDDDSAIIDGTGFAEIAGIAAVVVLDAGSSGSQPLVVVRRAA